MSLFAGMARQAAALPPIQPPAQPQRRGLFGGGQRPDMNSILTFLSQGTNGLDRNRANASAQQAAQIAEQQRQQREQYAATIQDPRERQLFMTAPEQWAENIGQQFAPQVVSAGSAQVVNGRRTVEQPTYSERGDTILERSSSGVNPVFTRTTPSISEQTAQKVAETGRINATNPVAVAQNSILANPLTGATVATGMTRPEIVSTPAGGTTNVFDANGNVTNTVQGNPANGGRNGAMNFDATTRGALQAARNQASSARTRAADAARFVELNQQAGTGLGAQLLGPLAGLNPVMAEMRAISARLIPQEREPGSGSSSDRDVALYGRAVLDVDKPGPVNQAMAGVIQAQAQRDADYAAFLDEYATQNGNLNGAQEDWQAYANANPLFTTGQNGLTAVVPTVQPWRQFMGYGERQRGGTGGAQQGQVQSRAPDRAALLAEARRRGLVQ